MRGGRAWLALLAACAVLAGGCGGHSDQPGLSAGQRNGLIAQLEAARATAAARDLAGTEAALRRFRTSVARLERAGALTPGAARVLRLGAQRVLARVGRDTAPPPAPTVTTPAPAPPPPPKKAKHGEKPKEKAHGKGKGHGEGDD